MNQTHSVEGALQKKGESTDGWLLLSFRIFVPAKKRI